MLDAKPERSLKLSILPLSTLGTWEREFSMWSSTLSSSALSNVATRNPNMKLYRPGEHVSFAARQQLVNEWIERGGVMLLSYQMFASFVGESAAEVQRISFFFFSLGHRKLFFFMI